MSEYEDNQLLRSLDHRVDALETKFDRLASKVGDLASGLSSLESEVSNLGRRTEALEQSVEEIRNAISQYFSTFEAQVSRVAAALGEGVDHLSTVSQRLDAESTSEREGRERMAQLLQAIQQAQARLQEAIRKSFEETAGSVESLGKKQDAFRRTIDESAKALNAMIEEVGSQLGHQVSDVEAQIVALEQGGQEGVDRADETFKTLLAKHEHLSGLLDAIGTSSRQLSESLSNVSGLAQKNVGERTLRRAREMNNGALRLLAAGQAQAAVGLLYEARTNAPTMCEPCFNLAVALYLADRVEEAERVCSELPDTASEDSDIVLLRALLAARGEQWEKVCEHLELCRRAKPDEGAVAEALGIARIMANCPAEAQPELRAALRPTAPTRGLLERLQPAASHTRRTESHG